MKISSFQVILWTFIGYFLVRLFGLLLFVSSPSGAIDAVPHIAIECAVYLTLCSVFAGRRTGRSWSETFAVRRTSVWLVLLACLLGISIALPAEALASLIDRLAPLDKAIREQQERAFTPRSLAHAIALFVFVAGIGPFAEELFFRGALYTGLRPSHTPLFAGWSTGVCFTLSHDDPRNWLSILALSGLLAAVRAVSGSLWTSVFLHAAFNATALGVSLIPVLKNPSLALVLGGIPVSLALTGAIVLVGRSSTSAERARRIDLEPDPGIGETAP
jgi:membrane protease YdiL (CAAX protease family)